MDSSQTMHDALIGAAPHLRAFAISLCGDRHTANDLVQETMLKAWANREKFIPATNVKAWLFTILRNTFYSQRRKAKFELQDVEGSAAANFASGPEQYVRLDFNDFTNAMQKLSHEQREVLILIGAEGLSYDEAAVICGCAVGTIKSRLNRARARLAGFMNINSTDEIGATPQERAVAASQKAAWLR